MAHSLFKYVALAAGTFAAAAGATQSYAVAEVYNATNFFDKFGQFVSVLGKTPLDVDPTSGYVQYLDRDDAIKSGLVSIDGDEVYIGPETSQSYDPYGYGRKSVRLESLSTYNHGLFIADFTHLPKPTCGAWPAFWMFGTPWPTKGEIDIIENWNDLDFNRNTAHVGSPDVVGKCTIKASDMTATPIEAHNCYDKTPGQYDNQGCSADSYGLPFGLSEGGVYALEWTSDYLKIWSWTRALAPLDIQLGHPLPLTWGVPVFMITDCNVDQAFQDMKLVLNIDFCGVAGADGIWDSCKASTGYDTCTGYVAKNPEAFKDSYFKISDIKIYEQREDDVTTSSSSSSYTTSTASFSPSLSSSDVSSAGTILSAFSTLSSVFSATPTAISTNSFSFLSTTFSISPCTFSSPPIISTFDSSSCSEKPTSYNYNSTAAALSSSSTEIRTSSCTESSDGIPGATSGSISATIPSPYGASTIVSFSNTASITATTAAAELTALAVYTSCAPTVTNCPAGSGEVVTVEASSAPSSSPVLGGSSTAPSDLVVVSATTATLVPLASSVPVASSLSDHSVTVSLSSALGTTVAAAPGHGGDSGSASGVSVNGSKKTGITSVGLLAMVAVLMFAM